MESPAESMALRIPIWARPFAPPPLSVSPSLGLLPGEKESFARESEFWAKVWEINKKITHPVKDKVRTEIKNGSLLIITNVCYKITKRKMENLVRLSAKENISTISIYALIKI